MPSQFAPGSLKLLPGHALRMVRKPTLAQQPPMTSPCFILRVRGHIAQASPATVLSLVFTFPFSISTLAGEVFRSLKMPGIGHLESSNIARDGIKPPAESR